MDINIKVTDDELDELLAEIKDNPKLASISWQLRGYWIMPGDAPPATSLEN